MELANVTLGFTCRIVRVRNSIFFEKFSDLNCEKNCSGDTKKSELEAEGQKIIHKNNLYEQ